MRLIRAAVSASIVLTAIVAPGPAPVQAAGFHWELSESYQYADVGFTLAGKVAGRPGNAHSGYFNFEGDDDGVTAELFDWKCPAGATPPVDAYPAPTNGCVLKAYIWIQQPQFINTYHFGKNLLHNRIQITVPVEDSLTGTIVDTPLDIKIHGLDPLEKTVDYWSVEAGGDVYHWRDVVLKRPAAFSGKLAWLSLSNPRLQISSADVTRFDSYLKVPNEPSGS